MGKATMRATEPSGADRGTRGTRGWTNNLTGTSQLVYKNRFTRDKHFRYTSYNVVQQNNTRNILSRPRHLLFEKTTGSSPDVSRNWSLQSSSHVLAYPSSNRTSRSRRMLTVAMRVSVVQFTQRESSVIVGETAYRESPTASRRNWPDLHAIGTRQQPPLSLKQTASP